MITVPLSRPVVHDGIEHHTITFREPKLSDFIAMMASLSDMPIEAFRKIKIADAASLLTATAALVGASEYGTYTVPFTPVTSEETE